MGQDMLYSDFLGDAVKQGEKPLLPLGRFVVAGRSDPPTVRRHPQGWWAGAARATTNPPRERTPHGDLKRFPHLPPADRPEEGEADH